MEKNKWHLEKTKIHTCIWSDEWMENAMKHDHRERLNPKDAKGYVGNLPDSLNWCDPTTSVCDSPTPEYKINQGDAEKSTSAKCARCDFPIQNEEGNRRLYCMCGQ